MIGRGYKNRQYHDPYCEAPRDIEQTKHTNSQYPLAPVVICFGNYIVAKSKGFRGTIQKSINTGSERLRPQCLVPCLHIHPSLPINGILIDLLPLVLGFALTARKQKTEEMKVRKGVVSRAPSSYRIRFSSSVVLRLAHLLITFIWLVRPPALSAPKHPSRIIKENILHLERVRRQQSEWEWIGRAGERQLCHHSFDHRHTHTHAYFHISRGCLP